MESKLDMAFLQGSTPHHMTAELSVPGTFMPVPLFSLVFCYYDKCQDKGNQRRLGFASLTLPDHKLSVLKSGKQIKLDSGSPSHGRMLLTGWLTALCSANFLIEPRTTCLGMVVPTVGWALLYLSSIKTISHGHGHRPIWSGEFFSWESFFCGD